MRRRTIRPCGERGGHTHPLGLANSRTRPPCARGARIGQRRNRSPAPRRESPGPRLHAGLWAFRDGRKRDSAGSRLTAPLIRTAWRRREWERRRCGLSWGRRRSGGGVSLPAQLSGDREERRTCGRLQPSAIREMQKDSTAIHDTIRVGGIVSGHLLRLQVEKACTTSAHLRYDKKGEPPTSTTLESQQALRPRHSRAEGDPILDRTSISKTAASPALFTDKLESGSQEVAFEKNMTGQE